jgi:adenylate cyclase
MSKNLQRIGKFKYFFLVNGMLLANQAANIIGDLITDIFFSHRFQNVSEKSLSVINKMDIAYGAICVVIIFIITLWYEKPIRKCLKLFAKNETLDSQLLELARKRLLNEPYMVVAMDIVIWGFGSILFAFLNSPVGLVMGIASSLIIVMVAFFWVEHVSQHNLVPIFFPDGELSKTRGTRSISLKSRLVALVVCVSIIPLAFIHLTIHQFKIMQENNEITLLMMGNRLQETIAIESIMFIVIAIFISIMVWHNLEKPVAEIIRVLRQVKKGDLEAKAVVYTRDEIGFAGETLNAMTVGLREREMIKDTFGRYVDSKIRDEILNGNIPLDGELKKATILFADLRNFTPLVEVTPPKELIHLLNDYLSAMSDVIKAHRGLVLQFIGDEIEAVFGAPIHDPDHVTAAVNAAIEMRKQLDKINKTHIEEGYASLSHGIGIHTGQVLAANIGSSNRRAYSLIGDTVNTASRIQDLNKEFGTNILVSEKVSKHLGKKFVLHALPEVTIKGKTKPIKVFSVE